MNVWIKSIQCFKLLTCFSGSEFDGVFFYRFFSFVDDAVAQSWWWRLLACTYGSDVPTVSPSRGGDFAVCVFHINQPSLPTPFYSVLVSVSVFVALSTVFHSINSPYNCPLSHSVLPVYFCVFGPFVYISLYGSLLQPWFNPCGWLGLKHQLINQLPMKVRKLVLNPLWLTGLTASTN